VVIPAFRHDLKLHVDCGAVETLMLSALAPQPVGGSSMGLEELSGSPFSCCLANGIWSTAKIDSKLSVNLVNQLRSGFSD